MHHGSNPVQLHATDGARAIAVCGIVGLLRRATTATGVSSEVIPRVGDPSAWDLDP